MRLGKKSNFIDVRFYVNFGLGFIFKTNTVKFHVRRNLSQERSFNQASVHFNSHTTKCGDRKTKNETPFV